MKTLLLIRHAKSSWETGAGDFERPLNDRGQRDAPDMAGRMLNKAVAIDAFICSEAKRARQTAELFSIRYELAPTHIHYEPDLYLAGSAALQKVIINIDDRYASAAIFAHNPGLTDLANTLTTVRVDDMPTCSIYAVTIMADSWKDFAASKKEFQFFDYPKNSG